MGPGFREHYVAAAQGCSRAEVQQAHCAACRVHGQVLGLDIPVDHLASQPVQAATQRYGVRLFAAAQGERRRRQLGTAAATLGWVTGSIGWQFNTRWGRWVQHGERTLSCV